MSLIVKPYAERRRQPSVALVSFVGERLRYVTNNGECREGDPETLWRELAQRERYVAHTVDRGRPRNRLVNGAPPIVVSPRRGSIRDLVTTCDARHWVGLRNDHGKYKTIVHDNGPTVKRLGINADSDLAAEALFTFVAFCNSKGVRFNGSVAGAGYNLFRTTLTKPLSFWSPPNVMEALWPGRRECLEPPKRYYDMAYYDIKSAYPYALMDDGSLLGRGIPTHWRWQAEGCIKAANQEAYGDCRVFVPYDNTPPNPFPVRLRPGTRRENISYMTGAFTGTYPFREMITGYDYILANPTNCWVPDRYTDAFASVEWQALRLEMRSLPGLAGKLGKLADNSLWGMFAFDNSADKEIRWLNRNGDPNNVEEKRKPGVRRIHGAGVAVTVTARVRKRVYDGIKSSDAIYCDTDGIIAPYLLAPSYMNGKRKKTEGEWELKQRFGVIDIKAPQVYRWLNDGDVNWRYFAESMPHKFDSFPIEVNRPNGDGMGNAGAMSQRVAQIRKLRGH